MLLWPACHFNYNYYHFKNYIFKLAEYCICSHKSSQGPRRGGGITSRRAPPPHVQGVTPQPQISRPLPPSVLPPPRLALLEVRAVHWGHSRESTAGECHCHNTHTAQTSSPVALATPERRRGHTCCGGWEGGGWTPSKGRADSRREATASPTTATCAWLWVDSARRATVNGESQ